MRTDKAVHLNGDQMTDGIATQVRHPRTYGIETMRGTTRTLTTLLAVLCSGCAARNGPEVVPEPPPDPIPEELRLTEAEQYPGQNDLVRKVGTANLDGKLVVLDAPSPMDPEGIHAQLVRQVVLDAGVPEEYVSIQGYTNIMRGEELSVPPDTRVIVRSDWPALRRWEDGEVLAKHNIIYVSAAGNVFPEFGSDRDYYRPDHPVWEKFQEWADYNSVMRDLRKANGKALLATWAEVLRTDGSIVPVKTAVMCGDAMEWCFAVRVPNDKLDELRAGHLGTSLAAPILGAHTFYLFQLWDTAEEVLGVLKECAIDAGDPGVDREFGLGIPTAICKTIQDREVQTAGASLTLGGGTAVVSSLLAGPGGSALFGSDMSFSFSSTRNAPDLFVSFSSVALGKTISRGDKMVISTVAGVGYAPLGVSSSLTGPGASLFAEAGMSRELLAAGNTSLAVLAAFGAETGPVRTLTGRAGAVLRHRSFSLYGGAVHTMASIPIPGHKAVGVRPAAVSKSGWEIALSRSFSVGRKGGIRPESERR